MSAVIQVHSHNRIPRLTDRKLDGQICLSTGMCLYIGIATAKQLFCPLNRQIFHNIHALTATVVSFTRVSFRILICQRTSHGSHYCLTHPVFRGNQLDMAILSLLLIHNCLCNFGIDTSYFIQ